MSRRCDSCFTKHALKYYCKNKDEVLEKKKSYYHNHREHKEYHSEQSNKRKSKISDLENQIKTLTEIIKSTITVT